MLWVACVKVLVSTRFTLARPGFYRLCSPAAPILEMGVSASSGGPGLRAGSRRRNCVGVTEPLEGRVRVNQRVRVDEVGNGHKKGLPTRLARIAGCLNDSVAVLVIQAPAECEGKYRRKCVQSWVRDGGVSTRSSSLSRFLGIDYRRAGPHLQVWSESNE